jgi:hypothetical protein
MHKSVFDFVLEFADIFEFFPLMVAQLTWTLTLHPLSRGRRTKPTQASLAPLKGLFSKNQYGLKVISIERSSFHIEPLIFLFLNFKGTCSLNSKRPVSVAKAKICGL